MLNFTDANRTYPFSGMCIDMLNGVAVDVLYAEAGLTNYRPIYTIVGAHIR